MDDVSFWSGVALADVPNTLIPPSRGSQLDANDIVFVMSRYWNSIDVNRIPEHDMDRFVEVVRDASPGWTAIKRKYGM